MAGFQGYRVVDTLDGAGQEDTGAGAFGDFRTDAFNDVRLEDEGGDGRDQDGNRQDREGRHPFQNQDQRQQWDDEQPGGDAELFGQDGRVQVNLGRLRRGMQQTDDREDNEGDDYGRYRREHHISDMREQRDSVDGGGHDGRVGQRGNLIAEVGTGNDGAGNQSVRKTFGPTDAQQGDSDGGDGRPRTARHDGNHGADDAGRQEEHLGADDLDPIVDEGRNDSAHRPGARYRADEEQDKRGAGDIGKVVPDGGVESFPRGLEEDGRQQHTYTGRGKQRHLACTQDGFTAVNADVDRQKRYQDEDGNQGDDRPCGGWFHMRSSYTRKDTKKCLSLLS